MQFSTALIALVAAGLANAQLPDVPSCSVCTLLAIYYNLKLTQLSAQLFRQCSDFRWLLGLDRLRLSLPEARPGQHHYSLRPEGL
jgi:hypothetical protein